MEERNGWRLTDSAPLRIGLQEAERSNFARELYTNCFFHPDWLHRHAPLGTADPLCLSCGGDEGYERPDAPFCFGIHVVLNDEQWYGAVLCCICFTKLLTELRPADD